MLNQAVKKNEITQEQAAQSMAKFNQTRKFADQVEKTKLNLTADKKAEVVNLLSEKNDLQKQIKDVDPSLASVQKERINEIDDAIKTTAQEAKKHFKDIRVAKVPTVESVIELVNEHFI